MTIPATVLMFGHVAGSAQTLHRNLMTVRECATVRPDLTIDGLQQYVTQLRV